MRRKVFSCANKTASGLHCWTADKPERKKDSNKKRQWTSVKLHVYVSCQWSGSVLSEWMFCDQAKKWNLNTYHLYDQGDDE